MQKIARRDFIKYSIITGSAALIGGRKFTAASYSQVPGANDQIRIAIVGFNSKGKQHIEEFYKVPGVKIVALCDVDKDILEREAALFRARGETVTMCQDVRKILDDKNIDALVIATPNHWHSLLGIWACQAGKDVYVEKPVSHNVWEGRQLVNAARKYNRIVQSGTQNRSDTGLREAMAYIKEGNLGKIQWAYGLWYKQRFGIGMVTTPQIPPANIDFNLWTGPAEMKPLMRKNVHYDWHWFWNTGNGDLANTGVHQIDDCRFMLGDPGYPKRVMSFGSRFAFDDNAETPNTHLAVFEFASAPPIIIEIRNLPMKKGMTTMDHFRGVRDGGNIIQCENGYFAGGRGGGWIYDNDNKKIIQFPGDGGGSHGANFIDAVRSRKSSELHSEIIQGHISSAYCHFANISWRLGEQRSPEAIKEQLSGNQVALDGFERVLGHLTANEIDLQKTPITCGPWLEIDAEKEKVKGKLARQANKQLSRKYRKPFVVPKKV
ncbi:MAG TPA: Gfo/Idh/MocA family oxidoreductase [bacterium]|nr:Gfo/Idh/MocA family oxidoreductase [bacterium]HPN42976.1 Gfo/Idh/MocA family oxidoreductase [bacterium]